MDIVAEIILYLICIAFVVFSIVFFVKLICFARKADKFIGEEIRYQEYKHNQMHNYQMQQEYNKFQNMPSNQNDNNIP